jgi:D-alanyl-lipoteichoic acid acyltransferase DltB (MBOAT superfamily)
MERFRFHWLRENVDQGARYMALGLFFKCCLADNLAAHLDRSVVNNAFLVWMANLIFGLRIYYDFAGYSLIAVGLARMLGITLTLNFLSPYASTSVAEFWRRWHVTLSQWFRDYLYVPLGGGRTKWWAFNVALVFVVSGIWHGAGWNFLFWGALHALFLIFCRLLRVPLPRAAAWGITMVACFFAWLSFYETDTSVLLAKMGTLLNPFAYSAANAKAALHQWATPNAFVMFCFLGLTSLVLVLEWQSVARKDQAYFYLLRLPALTVMIVLAILLAPGKSNDFIYFAF